MKIKFLRLSKEERKAVIKEYRSESEKNDNYISTLNRMFILGIVGFIYGTLAILFDIFVLNVSFWTYLIDAIVMIFTIFLIVQRNRLLNATMNHYLINKSTVKEEVKEDKTITKKSTKKEEVEIPKKKETKKTSTKKTTSKTKKTSKKA